MRSGEMDRRIEIQTKHTVQNDDLGEEIEEWTTMYNVWADVKQLRGQEFFNSQQTVAKADTQFRIRFLDGITPVMRIRYQERDFDIKQVIEFGRREGLEILAESRAE